jgi:hypothetical protein
MPSHLYMFGLPTDTAIVLLAMILLPVATLVLYWIDLTTNDGYVSILGRR